MWLRYAHEMVELLFRVRFAVYPNCPVPLAKRFMASWFGRSEGTAWNYTTALREAGIIQQVGTIIIEGRPCAVYLPVGIEIDPHWRTNASTRDGSRPR